MCIFVLYIALYVAHALYLGKTVYGDGIFYFSWLRSTVVDTSVDFANEYKHFTVTQPITPLGAMGNKYSIGPAILWSPHYLMIHTLIRGDGYTFPYQLVVGLTTILYTVFGFVLLYRLLPGTDTGKLLIVVAIAAATHLLFYGSVDAVNSHGLSFFAAALFLSFVLATKPNWTALGFALAVLAMIRLQDAAYILVLLPYWKKIYVKQFAVGFLIAFTPQLVAWYALYGSPWTNPYLAGGESFDLLRLHILEVLFSPENGLFLWTPIALLGFIGLITKKILYWNFLLVFLAELLIVASWSTWWQGASYSGRMFVSTLPLLAFGLTPGINWLIKIVGVHVALLFIATFGALNILSILYFLLSH